MSDTGLPGWWQCHLYEATLVGSRVGLDPRKNEAVIRTLEVLASLHILQPSFRYWDRRNKSPLSFLTETKPWYCIWGNNNRGCSNVMKHYRKNMEQHEEDWEFWGKDHNFMFIYLFLNILFIYLTDKITSRQRGRKRERRKQAPCWGKSLMQGSNPGPWDHDQSRRQRLNPLSHPGTPKHKTI